MELEQPQQTQKNTPVKTPWRDRLGEIPFSLTYENNTVFEAMEKIARKTPRAIAFDFAGKSTTYGAFLRAAERCAAALDAIGVKQCDRVTVAMPNCPQALELLYGLSRIGAVANIVHPLSSEKEMEFFLCDAGSETILVLDAFYPKIAAIRNRTPLKRVIVTSIADVLNPLQKIGYALTEGKKVKKIPRFDNVLSWHRFKALGRKREAPAAGTDGAAPAAILYSGGTTGVTKGILLSNYSFNALAKQIIATNPMFTPGDKMLAAMPLFHGFGLGVCVHAMLTHGGRCLLVPRFTPESYARLIYKDRCNFIAGVPTLYESLLHNKEMEGKDLSCLKGVYCGGDVLPIELKKKIDAFLREHGAPVQVREGYGATESVNACCLTPPTEYREGSIGFPFPDTYIKIVKPDTEEEVPLGTDGEILLTGPTLMTEYVGKPDETAKALRRHADGFTWLYTGDLGMMDADGFVYFKGRLKRMIVSSGYNIYPAQLENVFDACPEVERSCVIGVPDPYKMARPKVFVILKPGFAKSEATKKAILNRAAKSIARYAMPKELEFRDEFPKTQVGKVAYRVLEEEEAAKRKVN